MGGALEKAGNGQPEGKRKKEWEGRIEGGARFGTDVGREAHFPTPTAPTPRFHRFTGSYIGRWIQNTSICLLSFPFAGI